MMLDARRETLMITTFISHSAFMSGQVHKYESYAADNARIEGSAEAPCRRTARIRAFITTRCGAD